MLIRFIYTLIKAKMQTDKYSNYGFFLMLISDQW